MLLVEDIQDSLACLGALVLRLEHPFLLSLHNPENCQLQFSPEHQAVVYLSLVLRVVSPPAGGEILLASAQCILHQHHLFPIFPGVQSPINPLPDLALLGDMSGALEVHRL